MNVSTSRRTMLKLGGAVILAAIAGTPGAALAQEMSKALGVDDRFWINIQVDYNLEVERDLRADELTKVVALV